MQSTWTEKKWSDGAGFNLATIKATVNHIEVANSSEIIGPVAATLKKRWWTLSFEFQQANENTDRIQSRNRHFVEY
jgi:hypothetical protein